MAKVRLQGNKNLINERLNAQVDWNTVGSQISSNFEEAAAFRKNKIKEIEDATKELGKTVEDKPIGTNKYLNDFIFETSNVSSSYAYQLNQMWKRGEISANEYKKKIHGLGSRIGGTFDAIKDVNKNQQEIIKRSQEGKSSAFEMALAEKLLPFSNFNKLTPTISPKNGNLVFATDDGKNVHIMDDRQFAAGMQFRSDKLNLNGLLSPRIEESGIYINQYLDSGRSIVEFMSQTGDDITPEGKERKKKVDQYLDSIADEILSNPYNTASILMDSIGGYDIALDQIPDGVDKEKFILTSIDDNGVVQIDTETPEGKKQLKAARDEIKNRLAVMMDEKRGIKPLGTGGTRGGGSGLSSDENVLSYYKATEIIADGLLSGAPTPIAIQTWNEYDDKGVLLTKTEIPDQIEILNRRLGVLEGDTLASVNIGGEQTSLNDILAIVGAEGNKQEGIRRLKSQIEQLQKASEPSEFTDILGIYYLDNSSNLSMIENKNDLRSLWSDWKKDESWGTKVDPTVVNRIWSVKSQPEGTKPEKGELD